MTRRNGQSLVELGIGVMIAMVVLVGVAIPVVQDSLVTERTTVTNESVAVAQDAPNALPQVLSLAEDETGIDPDSVKIFFHDEAATTGGTGNTFVLSDANFTTLDEGPDVDDHVNVTGPFSLINSTNDEYNVSYDGEPEGFIDSSVARTTVDFLPLMLAVAAFVAAMSLVS